MIPKQLREWRFILITPKQKIPTAEMKGWAADRENKTFHYYSPTLLAHLQNGGNYGVVTGNDRFVVGADTKEIEQAIEQRLPKTFTVQSPRHKTKHFYFYGNLTNPIRCKPTAQGDPCADVKFGNAYVLGVGSVFENYGSYQVIDDVPIAAITEEQLIAAINEFMITNQLPEVECTPNVHTVNPELNFPITAILPNIDGLMQHGNSLIGPHPVHGSTTGSNFHVETEKNVWHCFRDNSGGGPLELLAVMHGIIRCADAGKGCLRGEKFKQVIAKAQELDLISESYHIGKNNSESEFIKQSKKGKKIIDVEAILAELFSKFTFKTPTDIEEIYYYNDGKYTIAEYKIKSLLEEWLGENASTYIVNEILNHIRRMSYVERSEFNRYSKWIPVQNGLLNLKSLKLEPFSKNKIFTFKLNVSFDSEAKCPKWEKFVSEVLLPEDALTLQEYLGYCLLPAMPYHKLLWMHGCGRNGKGVIIRTLEAILGKENCAHLAITEFSGYRRFAAHELYGKMINVSSEPLTDKILETPFIKQATGQDQIDAEVKCKQRRVTFTNIAKFFIVGNRYPKINDTTLAMDDRNLAIEFPYSFTGPNRIADIEKTWLSDSKEVSGILNWMLEGLSRLLMQNEFTVSKTQQETKLELKRLSDPIGAWQQERCYFHVDKHISRSDAYESYKTYADEIGTTPESSNKFINRMRATPKVKDGWVGKDRVWKGIALRIIDPEQPTIEEVTTPTTPTTLKTKSEKIDKKDVLKDKETSVVNAVGVVSSERICGHCANWHKPGCPHPNPTCITPSNTFALECRAFILKEAS